MYLLPPAKWRHSLHRVTKVKGDTGKDRMIAILSYETRPGVHLNEYTRLKFYGRTYWVLPISYHDRNNLDLKVTMKLKKKQWKFDVLELIY